MKARAVAKCYYAPVCNAVSAPHTFRAAGRDMQGSQAQLMHAYTQPAHASAAPNKGPVVQKHGIKPCAPWRYLAATRGRPQLFLRYSPATRRARRFTGISLIQQIAMKYNEWDAQGRRNAMSRHVSRQRAPSCRTPPRWHYLPRMECTVVRCLS